MSGGCGSGCVPVEPDCKVIGNAEVKPDFAGRHEAMFIRVGGCNVFYVSL